MLQLVVWKPSCYKFPETKNDLELALSRTFLIHFPDRSHDPERLRMPLDPHLSVAFAAGGLYPVVQLPDLG